MPVTSNAPLLGQSPCRGSNSCCLERVISHTVPCSILFPGCLINHDHDHSNFAERGTTWPRLPFKLAVVVWRSFTTPSILPGCFIYLSSVFFFKSDCAHIRLLSNLCQRSSLCSFAFCFSEWDHTPLRTRSFFPWPALLLHTSKNMESVQLGLT